jgi:hypothetical protein
MRISRWNSVGLMDDASKHSFQFPVTFCCAHKSQTSLVDTTPVAVFQWSPTLALDPFLSVMCPLTLALDPVQSASPRSTPTPQVHPKYLVAETTILLSQPCWAPTHFVIVIKSRIWCINARLPEIARRVSVTRPRTTFCDASRSRGKANFLSSGTIRTSLFLRRIVWCIRSKQETRCCYILFPPVCYGCICYSCHKWYLPQRESSIKCSRYSLPNLCPTNCKSHIL